MNFEEALAYLLRLGHETLAIKFGLENTERLLEALHQPHLSFPKVQIAGTNGKGSTAVMLEAICRSANIRTGLYTSPHLVSITERIRVCGHAVSEVEFAHLTTHVANAANQLCKSGLLPSLPTFFEHVTALALLAFSERHVELGILETGLGGRLDATTCASAEVVAITPIALDHQEYLGTTIEQIAAEKAAVIRRGTTAIISPQRPDVLNIILARCAECGIRPILVDRDTRLIEVDRRGHLRLSLNSKTRSSQDVRLNLPGRHQATNASVAIAIADELVSRGFDIPTDAVIKGVETAEHPGRLEWKTGSPSFLFDGAHNVEGAKALRAYLDEFVRAPITLVFGAMRDKELAIMASALFPIAEHIILTVIDNPRSATYENLLEFANLQTAGVRAGVFESSIDAMRAAIEQTSPDGVICVTGSLYLIGEVKAKMEAAD